MDLFSGMLMQEEHEEAAGPQRSKLSCQMAGGWGLFPFVLSSLKLHFA